MTFSTTWVIGLLGAALACASATFPLLRASYGFVGEKAVGEALVRTCRTGG